MNALIKLMLYLFDDKNKLLFTSRNKKLTTIKGALGFINSILDGYSLKISMSSRERCNGSKIKLISILWCY